MDIGLEGKNAVVLASSKGIGKAIAGELAAEGAAVLISGRDGQRLKDTQEELEKETGGTIHCKTCDVSRKEDIHSLIDYAADIFDGIDILVNNTGGPKKGTLETLTDEDWLEAHESTFLSAVRAIREVRPHMKKRGGGRILNIASLSVKQPLDGLILSNAYRNAINGLTKTLQTELADDNILINLAAPGIIDTERIAYLEQTEAETEGMTPGQIRERKVKDIPLGRYGTPEEFAKGAVFLCSGANTYITGQTLLMDGGMVKNI